MHGVRRLPVTFEDIGQLPPQIPLCRVLGPEDEPDPAGVDEVVRGPVGRADVAGLVGDHVLVVVHAGEGDLGLGGREGGHLEEPALHADLAAVEAVQIGEGLEVLVQIWPRVIPEAEHDLNLHSALNSS